MKRTHFALCLIVAFALGVLVGRSEEVSFTTTTGRAIKGELTRVEPDGIKITTGDGIDKIPFGELPVELQTKFGYDPAKAAQFQAARAQVMQQAAARANAAAAGESRFAGFVAEIEALKRKKLFGAIEAAKTGSSKNFEAEMDEEIQRLELKLAALRRYIAVVDGAGTKPGFAEQLIDAVHNNKVFIGMPAAFLPLCWGEPSARSKSVSGGGTAEHWHYRDGYVAVDDGFVTYISVDQ